MWFVVWQLLCCLYMCFSHSPGASPPFLRVPRSCVLLLAQQFKAVFRLGSSRATIILWSVHYQILLWAGHRGLRFCFRQVWDLSWKTMDDCFMPLEILFSYQPNWCLLVSTRGSAKLKQQQSFQLSWALQALCTGISTLKSDVYVYVWDCLRDHLPFCPCYKTSMWQL